MQDARAQCRGLRVAQKSVERAGRRLSRNAEKIQNPIKPTQPLQTLQTDRVINDKNEEKTGLVAAWLTM
jgi:hypothetical protein